MRPPATSLRVGRSFRSLPRCALNILLLGAAAGVLAADRAARAMVVRWLAEGQSVPVGRSVGLRRVTARSLGLGALSRGPALVVAWLVVAAGVIAVVALALPPAPPVAVGAGAALGGAGANALHLARGRGVVDYIALWRWPPFNLADVAIVCGVAAVVAGAL